MGKLQMFNYTHCPCCEARWRIFPIVFLPLCFQLCCTSDTQTLGSKDSCVYQTFGYTERLPDLRIEGSFEDRRSAYPKVYAQVLRHYRRYILRHRRRLLYGILPQFPCRPYLDTCRSIANGGDSSVGTNITLAPWIYMASHTQRRRLLLRCLFF